MKDNIEVIKRSLGAFNAHDLAGFVAEMAGSVLDYTAGAEKPLVGPQAILEDNSGFLGIFPDAQFRIDNIFGAGDWVCVQGIFEGTHQGAFPGPGGQSVAPTGKKIRVAQCMVVKVERKKITEIHEYFDHVSFLTQLGVIM